MLRSVTLGVVLAVLASACALVEPPVPAGSVPTQARVENLETFPVELAVKTQSGVLPGAVAPASLPASGTAHVTFYLPVGDWWITVNGTEMFPAADVRKARVQCSVLAMEVTASGGGNLGCVATGP